MKLDEPVVFRGKRNWFALVSLVFLIFPGFFTLLGSVFLILDIMASWKDPFYWFHLALFFSGSLCCFYMIFDIIASKRVVVSPGGVEYSFWAWRRFLVSWDDITEIIFKEPSGSTPKSPVVLIALRRKLDADLEIHSKCHFQIRDLGKLKTALVTGAKCFNPEVIVKDEFSSEFKEKAAGFGWFNET